MKTSDKTSQLLENEYMKVCWDDDLKTLRVYSSDGESYLYVKREVHGSGLSAIVRDDAKIAVWGESTISITPPKSK